MTIDQQYDAFRSCMISMLKKRGVDLSSKTKPCSQEKLSRLMTGAFNDLVCDICDEIRRRERNDPSVKFLPSEDKYVEKRNQARNKLATLSDKRFEELSFGVLRELDQRILGSRAEGQRRQIPMSSSAARVLPNKTAPLAQSSTYTGPGMSGGSMGQLKKQTRPYAGADATAVHASSGSVYPSSATYDPGSTANVENHLRQKALEPIAESFQSTQSLLDDAARSVQSRQSPSKPNSSRNDEISLSNDKQIKENLLLLQMDVKEVKRENQKLKSILKEISIKLNQKADEVSQISGQLEELRNENLQCRRIISNLEVRITGEASAADESSADRKWNNYRKASDSRDRTPGSFQKDKPVTSARSSEKLDSRPTEDGEAIKKFVDVSDSLMEAVRSMESSEMLNSMKNFILKLKEITNESSKYKELCESSGQLDELQACQEYVMVSSGNLVEIVKELSMSSQPTEAQYMSGVESTLEVTKNSVHLLAKLIRQLLANIYRSRSPTKMSKEQIKAEFNKWVISSKSLLRSSDLMSNVLPAETSEIADTGKIKEFLEEQIANIVPLIKSLIEKIKPPVRDVEKLGFIVENIHDNFNKIIVDVGASESVIPPNVEEKSSLIISEMNSTNKLFFSQSKKFLEDTSETQLISEISNLCYDMAKQIKDLFSLF